VIGVSKHLCGAATDLALKVFFRKNKKFRNFATNGSSSFLGHCVSFFLLFRVL
jgi:hypothetical protein